MIRSFELSDAEGLLQVFGDPEVRKYLPPFPDPTLERMQAGVGRRMAMERDHGHGLWAVERKDARAWYTRKLEPDWRRHTLEEAEALFADLGLTGDFWQLR